MTYYTDDIALALAAEDAEHDAQGLAESMRIAEELIGHAERALKAGTAEAAADYMRSAAHELLGEA
jgi:hypothetical protein